MTSISLGAFRWWYLSVKIISPPWGCEWEGLCCSCFYSSYLSGEACCSEPTCAGGGDQASALRQKDKGRAQKSSRIGFLLLVSGFTLSGVSVRHLWNDSITPTPLCALITGSTSSPGLSKLPSHHKHRLVLQQQGEIQWVINMESCLWYLERVCWARYDSPTDSPSNHPRRDEIMSAAITSACTSLGVRQSLRNGQKRKSTVAECYLMTPTLSSCWNPAWSHGLGQL